MGKVENVELICDQLFALNCLKVKNKFVKYDRA